MNLKLASVASLIVALATALVVVSGTNGKITAGQFAGLGVVRAMSPQAPSCGVQCGTERWAVKTLTDADHGKVNFQPKKTTVGWLVAEQEPNSLPENARIAPIETQTYQVQASLHGFKLESDHDFHIVIADLHAPQETMIVEIPDPACSGVCASSHLQEIQAARADFVAHCSQPTSGFKPLHHTLTVTVTGVGFFDRLHEQTGVAPNGIELHPVLKIEFPTDTTECEQFAQVTRHRSHGTP